MPSPARSRTIRHRSLSKRGSQRHERWRSGSCCCSRRAAGRHHPHPCPRRCRQMRDRRRGSDPGPARTGGPQHPSPTKRPAGAITQRTRRLFSSQPIYEAAHILFAARKDDAEGYERARRDAASALAELNLNPERFGDLARICSACPSAAQAGNLGQITAGQTTPEFERALATLTPGSISQEPVETRYGVHIIRLGRKVEGRELPFELVADRIADYLCESVRRRAIAQYIARLVSGAEVAGVALESANAHRVN